MANKMTRRAGKKTGQFGRWLTDSLIDKPKYRVYYDHGNPKKSDNVAVIKSFIGEEVTNSNQLANVDVVVYNPDHEILLLIGVFCTSPQKGSIQMEPLTFRDVMLLCCQTERLSAILAPVDWYYSPI